MPRCWRAQPRPARSGRHHRGAAARARRRGHGQDARHHHAHRVPRLPRRRSREHPGRDLHQQGRGRDARARGRAGGPRAKEITVGTFHAFCARVLREHGQALGLPRKFTICDASDQLARSSPRCASCACTRRPCTRPPCWRGSRWPRTAWRRRRASWRAGTRRPRPARGLGLAALPGVPRPARASLDFDDLLLETVRLLREHEAVRAHYRERYRYVLVDEYQDTNQPQYEIVQQIGGEHRNVCVVGDDDQSIYGWRGADIRKILGFHRDFEGAKVVRLQTNYRSTRPILDAANAVIRQQRRPPREGAGVGAGRRRARALRAARRTRRRRRSSWSREMRKLLRLEEAKPQDFAILFRTQVQSRPFEGELRANGLPYVVVGRHVLLRPQGGARHRRLPEAGREPARRDVAAAHHQHARAREWGRRASTACSRSRPRRASRPARPSSAPARSTGSRRRRSRATGSCARRSTAPASRTRAAARVPRCERFLEAVGYRDEVTRLYTDPHDARGALGGRARGPELRGEPRPPLGRAVPARLPGGAGAHQRRRAGRADRERARTRSR